MNNSTLGYSFIDDQNETTKSQKTKNNKKIPTPLDKKTKMDPNVKKNKVYKNTNNLNNSNIVDNNTSVTSYVSPFDENDDTKNIPIEFKSNPLISSIEGFSEAMENSENSAGQHEQSISRDNIPAQEMIYDFGRHMNMNNNHTTREVDIQTDNNMQEKINYIIHVLEQNRQLRTETITEEMIMYFFLGFFVLYISENFVKMGKYTR
jgi:hypothetical protein